MKRQSFRRFCVIRTERRDELKASLRQSGIETVIHYPMPVYKQRAYRVLGYVAADLPNTAALSRQILSLPLYAEMSAAEVAKVAMAVRSFYEKGKERKH